MKKIVLSIMVAASLIACNTTEKVAVVDRNADTQNPIMPIVYNGGDDFTQTIYLTDYLPQVTCFDSLVFTTEPSYQVLKVEEGKLTFTGDHTLSILNVKDLTTGITYDIPIIPQSKYEVGLVTKSFTDSTITIGVLNEYEHLQFRVLWQDTRATEFVSYGQYDPEATITIEKAWRESKGRSFIRVFALGDGKNLNDLLIPLENGKVLADAAQLTRHDDQAQVLYSLMIDRFHNGNKKNDWKMNSPEVLDIVDYQGGDIAGITQKIKDGFFSEYGKTIDEVLDYFIEDSYTEDDLVIIGGQLADIIGVSDKAVSKWETSKGLPDISLVESLSRALGVSVMELMSGDTVINKNIFFIYNGL